MLGSLKNSSKASCLVIMSTKITLKRKKEPMGVHKIVFHSVESGKIPFGHVVSGSHPRKPSKGS